MKKLETFGYLLLFFLLRGIKFIICLFCLILPKKANTIESFINKKFAKLMSKEKEWEATLMFWTYLEDFMEYDKDEPYPTKTTLAFKTLTIFAGLVIIASVSWILLIILGLGLFSFLLDSDSFSEE